MAKEQIAHDVDQYLALLPPDARTMLEKLRAAIKAAAPEAEELISYRIPTYKYHGMLVHFLANEKYCSFVVTSKTTIEQFKTELADYKISGTTIHFTPDNPLPASLVKKIVKARLKENESKK